jgi:hypothetical protein
MQPRRHRDHGPVDVIHDGVPQRGLWYRRRGIAKTGAALSGGGFANITSAKADQKTFADFNGIDITIPGFTFTDIAFDVQLNPTEQSGTDSLTIAPTPMATLTPPAVALWAEGDAIRCDRRRLEPPRRRPE